jgi:hypothetical protein
MFLRDSLVIMSGIAPTTKATLINIQSSVKIDLCIGIYMFCGGYSCVSVTGIDAQVDELQSARASSRQKVDQQYTKQNRDYACKVQKHIRAL